MSINKQREEMESKIIRDYPDLNPFALRNLLDIYFAEDGKTRLDSIVKEQIKKDKKTKTEKQPTSTEIITNVEVRSWETSGYPERIAEEKAKVFQIISQDNVEPVSITE
jgi:hypothetical protein